MEANMTARELLRAVADDYVCDVACGHCDSCSKESALRALADRFDDEEKRAAGFRQTSGVVAWPVQDCIERLDAPLNP